MRLYVKLSLMIAVFAGLVSPTGRRMTGNLAYEIRVGLVCAFGNDADYERLIEYTERRIAVQSDSFDAYRARHRYGRHLYTTSDEPLSLAFDRRCDDRLPDGEALDPAPTVEGDEEHEADEAAFADLDCASTNARIAAARRAGTTFDDDGRP